MNTKRIISRIGLKLKKYSPEILTFLGLAGTVTSTVLACKATLNLPEIMEKKDEDMQLINDSMNDIDTYTEKDARRETTKVYAQTGVKIIRNYAPAIIVGVTSMSGILYGHNILKKRNLAIAAAYAVVDKGFKEYRGRVLERFGEKVDRELRYNIKEKEIENKIIDKNGKEKIKKEKIDAIDDSDPLSGISEYARFFDECTSDQHRKDPEYNLMFLRRQQDYANEKLKAEGHLFLNDVYSMLGIPKTKAGQVVGWIYDEKNPVGDNYVDFHIYDNKESNRLFVNGYEYSILLDFNVDGVIYDKI